MLGSCVRAESMKLRRSPIWLAYLLLPAFSCFIGSANYSANLEVLTPGWENLWTQQTIFICYFFLPPLLGVGCSYLWRLEHAGANWNGLMCAPVSPGCVFGAKLIVGAVLSAVSFASIAAFYVVSGVVLGVPGTFPTAQIALYLGLGFLGSLVIVAFQLVVSMLVRSFAAPVGVALAGGVAGLVATLAGAGNVFPYSLVQTAMNSNNLVDLSMATIIQVSLFSIVYVALACAFATRRLSRQDIVATV